MLVESLNPNDEGIFSWSFRSPRRHTKGTPCGRSWIRSQDVQQCYHQTNIKASKITPVSSHHNSHPVMTIRFVAEKQGDVDQLLAVASKKQSTINTPRKGTQETGKKKKQPIDVAIKTLKSVDKKRAKQKETNTTTVTNPTEKRHSANQKLSDENESDPIVDPLADDAKEEQKECSEETPSNNKDEANDKDKESSLVLRRASMVVTSNNYASPTISSSNHKTDPSCSLPNENLTYPTSIVKSRSPCLHLNLPQGITDAHIRGQSVPKKIRFSSRIDVVEIQSCREEKSKVTYRQLRSDSLENHACQQKTERAETTKSSKLLTAQRRETYNSWKCQDRLSMYDAHMKEISTPRSGGSVTIVGSSDITTATCDVERKQPKNEEVKGSFHPLLPHLKVNEFPNKRATATKFGLIFSSRPLIAPKRNSSNMSETTQKFTEKEVHQETIITTRNVKANSFRSSASMVSSSIISRVFPRKQSKSDV